MKRRRQRKGRVENCLLRNSYDKWVRFREMFEESNIKREVLIKEFVDFLRKVLPLHITHQQVFPKIESSQQTLSEQTQRFEVPSTSDNKDDIYGSIPSSFLSPVKPLLYTQYGIQQDSNNFKMSNSTVTVDNMNNVSMKGKNLKGRKFC